MEKRLLGAVGETMAAHHYRVKGYEIIGVNYRTRQGEIDIIAKKRKLIIFIEVKTRSVKSIAEGREFVNFSKQQKIILAAQNYISANKLSDNTFRFDVVEISVSENGEKKLTCIENAFDVT